MYNPLTGILPLLVLLAHLVAFLVASAVISRKAGYSGWWCLVTLVPFLNMTMIYVFAFIAWPLDTAVPPEPYSLCPFCKERIKIGAIKCKHCGEMVQALPV